MLIRYTVHYKRVLGINIVFTDENKRPLTEWGHLHLGYQSEDDLVDSYRKLIDRKARISGIAGVQSSSSRVIFIDIDEHGIYDPAHVSKELGENFLVHSTARGGIRILCISRDHLPHYASLERGGRRVGELAGTAKHLWQLPPSEIASGNGVTRYRMFLGGSEINPLSIERVGELSYEEIIETISTYFSLDTIRNVKGKSKAAVEVASGDTIYFFPPLFRDVSEFLQKANALIQIPRCVLKAIFDDEPIKKGNRFNVGSIAVIFLAALIDDKTEDEILSLVSKNLERYPEDEGEDLDSKFLRLLARYGDALIPSYMPFTTHKIPADICRECIIYNECRIRGSNPLVVWVKRYLKILKRYLNSIEHLYRL
jgi:DUF971 family protein